MGPRVGMARVIPVFPAPARPGGDVLAPPKAGKVAREASREGRPVLYAAFSGVNPTNATHYGTRTSRFQTRASPTSRPVRYSPPPFRKEGSCIVQRRRVDAGELKDPPEKRFSHPQDQVCLRRLALNRPTARQPHNGAMRLKQAAVHAALQHLPGTRDPRTCFSTGSFANRDAKSRRASRVPEPSTEFWTTASRAATPA